MKGRIDTKLFMWICVAVSFLCLFVGYGLKGYWVILVLLPAIPLYWFLMKKVSSRITISILLVIYILLMGPGSLIGISPYLILIGGSSALAAWESAQFRLNFQNASGSSADERLEQIHTRDLAVSVSSGLLLSLLGLNIHLRLPFGLIAILALIAVYGVYRIFKLGTDR